MKKGNIMEKTAENYSEYTVCSDCPKVGTHFVHWGDLVPKGKTGRFCVVCWRQRVKDGENNNPPRPFINEHKEVTLKP